MYFSYASLLAEVDPARVEVAVDTAVELQDGERSTCFLITRDLEPQPDRGEYAPTHALSRAVLGKRAGDEVITPSSTIPRRIVAVFSKYSFAFQQTQELLNTRFADQDSVRRVELPEDSPEEVKRIVTKLALPMEKRRNAALENYAAGRLTIGALARLLEVTPHQGIGIVAAGPVGLRCALNTVGEREEAARVLGDAHQPLLLDLTALTTIHELGLLHSPVLEGRPLIVAQSTIDDVNLEKDRWRRAGSRGAMTLGLRNEQVVAHEVSAERAQRFAIALGELVKWTLSECVVKAVSPELAQRTEKYRPMAELLGRGFWDSIHVCRTEGAILMSDDLWLRNLASKFDVPGVSTSLMLFDALRTGRNSAEEFAAATLHLILTGYRTIPVNSAVLVHAARKGSWHPGPELAAVLRGLQGPHSEVTSTVRTIVDFARRLWLELPFAQQRTALLMEALDAIVVGRRAVEVLQLFRAQLGVAFELLPIQAGEIERTLGAWERLRVA